MKNTIEKTPKLTDPKATEAMIADLYPRASSVRIAKSGYKSTVAIIDEKHAIHLPHTKSAWVRTNYESMVLQSIYMPDTIALVPDVIQLNYNPAYMIESFILGEHIDTIDLRTLPEAYQDRIAYQLAEFAFYMHQSMPTKELDNLRQASKMHSLPEIPWSVYFRKPLRTESSLNTQQAQIAKRLYYEWLGAYQNKPTVIHDDLHPRNILIRGHNLHGIIDFANTCIGTPEQEFWRFYCINDRFLEKAIEAYDNISGLKLNTRASKLWAILQEIAIYEKKLTLNTINHPSLVRASNNLNRWLSTNDWDIKPPHFTNYGESVSP